MSELWLNAELDLVFPLEIIQDCPNSLTTQDANGTVVCCHVSEEDEVTDLERRRIEHLAMTANSISTLGIGRVKDFEKAGKACESEWRRVN